MHRLRTSLLATVAVFGLPSLALAQSGVPLPDIDVTTDVPTAAPAVVAPAPAASSDNGNAVAGPFNFTQDVTPANNTRIDAQQIQNTGSPDAAATLQRVVPGVDVQATSGNELTPDVVYRGFVSSPVQGTPQGLAVYQNGVRINEAFGDTMNWDAIPTFAIASMDMISSNPVYGLNALGGAVNIKMKNGFTYQGGEFQLEGGSYGRLDAALQYGKQVGEFSFYGALEGVTDNGFRTAGSSDIRRFYGDLGYRANGNEYHLTAGLADNLFGASGPAPIQMLQQYWGNIYTYPQTQHYQIGQIALTGAFALSPSWTLTTDAYVRRYIQHTVDGNNTNVQVCNNPALLCFNDGTTPANGLNGQQLVNSFGPNPVFGEIDRSTYLTTSVGGSAQLTNTDTLFGMKNHATIGASYDFGSTNYTASPELGLVFPNYYVAGTGVYIGNSGSPVTEGPVDANFYNRYFGLYALDALDLTDKLTLSAGARLNMASISMSDQLGGNLNGNNQYNHLNPMVGLTYKITPDLLAYASYSEANRAPTPLELGCADPLRPCIMASFLVSDPPLQQVVSQTFEAGLRGQQVLANDWGAVGWKAGVYHTLSTNDILNVPDPFMQGYGYFANVGDTLRQGVETQLNYRKGPFTVSTSYAYIDATFRNYLTLGSNSPSADANGNIYVVPGDQIPLIPHNRAKLSLDWDVDSSTHVGADLLMTGPMRFYGDASNQQPLLPGYATVALRASHKVMKNVEVYARAENLFNQRYYTYGAYFQTNSLYNAFTNPEMMSPGQPLSVYGGVRVTF